MLWVGTTFVLKKNDNALMLSLLLANRSSSCDCSWRVGDISDDIDVLGFNRGWETVASAVFCPPYILLCWSNPYGRLECSLYLSSNSFATLETTDISWSIWIEVAEFFLSLLRIDLRVVDLAVGITIVVSGYALGKLCATSHIALVDYKGISSQPTRVLCDSGVKS